MKNYRIELLITKNRARLERMIKEDYSKNKILRQSQKLDKYINIMMRELVKQFSFCIISKNLQTIEMVIL